MIRKKDINHPTSRTEIAKYIKVSVWPPLPTRVDRWTVRSRTWGSSTIYMISHSYPNPVLSQTKSWTKYQSLGLTLLNARSSLILKPKLKFPTDKILYNFLDTLCHELKILSSFDFQYHTSNCVKLIRSVVRWFLFYLRRSSSISANEHYILSGIPRSAQNRL